MDAYSARIAAIHDRLGIPADYAERSGLALQYEPENLVAVASGRSERRHWLEPAAAAAWARLEADAERAGIPLWIVSAWRSVDYQAELMERKLSHGVRIEEILRVNAAPGYSEHHTGLAVDLAAPGCEALIEAFDRTAAFAWLCENAPEQGFSLSYPRGNLHGLVYEPWHWAFTPTTD